MRSCATSAADRREQQHVHDHERLHPPARPQQLRPTELPRRRPRGLRPGRGPSPGSGVDDGCGREGETSFPVLAVPSFYFFFLNRRSGAAMFVRPLRPGAAQKRISITWFKL